VFVLGECRARQTVATARDTSCLIGSASAEVEALTNKARVLGPLLLLASNGVQRRVTLEGQLTSSRRVSETAANWSWGWVRVEDHRRGKIGWTGSRRAAPSEGLLAAGMARFLAKLSAAWVSWMGDQPVGLLISVGDWDEGIMRMRMPTRED
jgi:hypothetical protein